MTALAIHLPQRAGLSRWAIAALAVLLAHIALVASIMVWSAQPPATPPVIPAVAVQLLPAEASSPEVQDQDLAVGPAMQEAEEARKQTEQDKPAEKFEQPPLSKPQAEIALPQAEEKQVEPPKPVIQPPAPETRAPPKTDRIGQLSEAAANAYNALVFGHMQRFKRYPASARGASGTVIVRFELNRAGVVTSSTVAKSSGHAALDQEALALFRRASPFPPFPSAKPGDHDGYVAPLSFSP